MYQSDLMRLILNLHRRQQPEHLRGAGRSGNLPIIAMKTTSRRNLSRGGLLLIAAMSAQMSAAQLRYVEMKATSMVYCPQDNRIYAAGAPDAKGTLANSVSRIDPGSGKVEASVFVGSNPKGIVRSSDGKSLYVLVADNKMVRQIDRATMAAGVNFPVGENQAARRITCVPELPDAVIVHRYNPSVSPQGDNLCVMVARFYLQEGPNLVIDWAVLLQEVRIPAIEPGQSYSVDLEAPFDVNVDVVGLYVVANMDPLGVNGSISNISRRID